MTHYTSMGGGGKKEEEFFYPRGGGIAVPRCRRSKSPDGMESVNSDVTCAALEFPFPLSSFFRIHLLCSPVFHAGFSDGQLARPLAFHANFAAPIVL